MKLFTDVMKLFIEKTGIARLVCLMVFSAFSGFAQPVDPQKPYQDLTHESKVFGQSKFYRLYVPDNYSKSDKRYPVIYFFHGWGGRHFKDDNAKLDYVKLKELINKYQVMMVMWDGSIEEKEPRPYNIGFHNDISYQIQMKDYFPELFGFIDSKYRTLTDRQHRGIIGFSMGGILSLYLSGKYPDKVSAAVSMTGSPEFFIGYPENHTLYQVRYTFKNVQDVATRVHTSETDILYNLNEEVRKGAIWEGKSVEFETFPGGHMVDKQGETMVFEKAMKFVTNTFKKEEIGPKVWSHYDLYANFDLWGYQVESDKNKPGFIYLKNVGEKGFGLYTQKWLPCGPPVEMQSIRITTAPVYKPDHLYNIVSYSAGQNKAGLSKLKSDAKGSLKFELDNKGNQIGIYENNAKPNWVVVDCRTESGSQFLYNKKSNKVTIQLLNRGGEVTSGSSFKVRIRTRDPQVVVKDSMVSFKPDHNNRLVSLMPVEIICSKKLPVHADPFEVKLEFEFDNGAYKDQIDLPVLFDAEPFIDVKIDDGVAVRDTIFGYGDANGVVNPGEKILVYEGKNRLRLFTNDKYVIKEDEALADEVLPAIWPDGYTESSVIHISPDCPDGHRIECIGNYETRTFNPIERKLNWGKVSFLVHKK